MRETVVQNLIKRFNSYAELIEIDVQAAIVQIDDWTQVQDALLPELSDHEVMHEGQIIRHLYGLNYEIPSSIKWA